LLQENTASLHNNLLARPEPVYSGFTWEQNDYVRFLPQFLSAVAVAALIVAAPLRCASTPQSQLHLAHTAAITEPVDINAASLDQLIKVPGLTRTWAARIIRFRPYRGKNELLDRGIVTAEVYARIKDHIIAHRIRD
jgi:DNA uptake protein ComE-like DNA-binding protein